MRNLLIPQALLAIAFLTGARVAAQETYEQLPPEMRPLARALFGMTRSPLERGGNTFYALGAVVPDSGELREFGTATTVEPREPSAFREALKEALRLMYASETRLVGIITDSIAARRAIAELEDAKGACFRIERTYRLEPAENYEFGRVVYDEPIVTNCVWEDYWKRFRKADSAASPIAVPKRSAPIRRRLVISSEESGFHTVGRFSGRVTILDDSVIVRLDSLLIWRRATQNQVPIQLDSISLAVGVSSGDSWSDMHASKALRIGRLWKVGDRFARTNLRFALPHSRGDQDKNNWLVVVVHGTAQTPGRPNNYTGPVWVYAHSKRGILRSN
ncbi:MAG TPA: hypothetical protein VM100_05370 [Longimicrobiales bacterium]|nr:hypothetical protein [Longimicrobiales bacterium]